MRRIVLSLAVMAAAALTACSGGGSVLSTGGGNNPDRVIVTVQAPTNIARVLPGASLPISAVAAKGSQNGFFTYNRYRWSAALVSSGQYPISTGGVTKACTAVTITQSGTATPFTADFSNYIAIDPTNQSNILFIPPVTIPVPATATPGSTIQLPAGNNPYCVVVSATALDGGAGGSITVAVVNPLGPEN